MVWLWPNCDVCKMASRDRIYLQKYILIESGCHDFTGAIIDVRKKRANECMCVKEKERKKDRSERERERDWE